MWTNRLSASIKFNKPFGLTQKSPLTTKIDKKKLKVEIEWKLLARIAEYYQFPSAVFLGNMKMFRHKTRSKAWRKKAELYDKIKAIVDSD